MTTLTTGGSPMRASEGYSRSARFSITERGRRDLRYVPTCTCRPALDGLLLACKECGTVYAYLKEESWGGQSSPHKKV